MLKQEDRLETQPQHAAKVRVTPEELAAAITRLEARKDADRGQVAGTIPIGEAMQYRGLALGLAGLLLDAFLDGNALVQNQRNHSIGTYNAGNIPQQISLTPDLLVSDASGKMVTFSAVKDN